MGLILVGGDGGKNVQEGINRPAALIYTGLNTDW
jgi:hypothetical protein